MDPVYKDGISRYDGVWPEDEPTRLDKRFREVHESICRAFKEGGIDLAQYQKLSWMLADTAKDYAKYTIDKN